MMTYRTHSRYLLMAGIAAVCVVLLVWQLLQGVDLAALLFLGVAVALLLVALRGIGSRVEADAAGITLLRPLARPLRIQYRQLIQATEEGRVQRVLVVLYYPLGADGLLDLQALRSQALPALEEQMELLTVLQTKTPR
jgi:hypothetical protein